MNTKNTHIRQRCPNNNIGLLFFFVSCCVPFSSLASAGTLDTTFNSSGPQPGTVITHVSSSLAFGVDIVIQQDGKLVVAGFAVVAGVNEFAVVRYNIDGSLDTSFNGTGIVTTGIGSAAVGEAIALQQDGKIVVAGEAVVAGVQQFAVVRYNVDGSLDTSFNNTGIATTLVGTSDEGNTIIIQKDGKIIVAGGAIETGISKFAVVRYNVDGSLDSSFNGTGTVTTDVGGVASEGNSVDLQHNGKIVVTGFAIIGGNSSAATVRYNMDGVLDTSFNGTGIVTTSVSSTTAANGVIVQKDDKIVITGTSNSSVVTIRYNVNGSLDTTFGGTGIVVTNIAGTAEGGRSVVIQHNEKIVITGFAQVGGVVSFAVIRYNPDGSLDSSFNSQGVQPGVVTTVVGFIQSTGFGGALQLDGKIVVAGTAQDAGTLQFAVARYNGDLVSLRDCTVRLISKYGLRV